MPVPDSSISWCRTDQLPKELRLKPSVVPNPPELWGPSSGGAQLAAPCCTWPGWVIPAAHAAAGWAELEGSGRPFCTCHLLLSTVSNSPVITIKVSAVSMETRSGPRGEFLRRTYQGSEGWRVWIPSHLRVFLIHRTWGSFSLKSGQPGPQVMDHSDLDLDTN